MNHLSPVTFFPPKRPAPPHERVLKVVSPFEPNGDQPAAIKTLVAGLQANERDQVLLGVTGSGKTFTVAKVIEAVQRPTLILAPNKTLAAQLYGEMKSFFPDNAVEYFVSYYDYYQPEAYVPRTDTYIEKDAQINEQIDRMRHCATQSLLERNDVVIVASVSCIYGIGSVETYSRMVVKLEVGGRIDRDVLVKGLVEQQYRRNDSFFARGTFRIRGETVDIWPSHLEDRAWRISLFGDEVDGIREFDPLTGETTADLERVSIYANSHYVTPRPTLQQAIISIKQELQERLLELEGAGRLLEAQRLAQRTQFDIEMLETTGVCKGIENYSRYLTGRAPGEPPPTLFEYLPENALLVVDESHVTIGQLGGMYRGDFARKSILDEFGFRLPSCKDNRPLKFEEWEAYRPQHRLRQRDAGAVGDGAHRRHLRRAGHPPDRADRPGDRDPPGGRPGGRPAGRMPRADKKGGRVLVTTLTKRMAEDLTEYMTEAGIRVRYLHSDVDTLERIEIIRDLRRGGFDVLVGINLLREGLDIPECTLVAILDADKEGFLRTAPALVQTIGRAARNVDGRVVLYADRMTDSLRRALEETDRRRTKQMAWNTAHGITPTTIKRQIADVMQSVYEQDYVTVDAVEGDTTAQFVGKDLRASSPSWRSACAPPPPTWNSRRPRGCATRSSGWRRWTWAWSRTWPGAPCRRRRRAAGRASPAGRSRIGSRSRWGRAAAATTRRSAAAVAARRAAPDRQVRRLHGILRRRVQPGGVDTLGRPPWLG